MRTSALVVLSALGLSVLSSAQAQTPGIGYRNMPGRPARQSVSLLNPDNDWPFYKVGIRHYDAGMMADLITRQDGIILVPPNFVIPANPSAPGMLAPPTVTTMASPPPGPAATAPTGQTPPVAGPAAAPAAANALPPGIKRIFVLESDNSLVFEADPASRAGTLPNKGNTP